MQTPSTVDIAITGHCNLACKYCFYADEMVALSDLSTEAWLTHFAELGRLGVMDVCLTGGEVFTRKDLFQLIDGIIANRMRYQLLTNGTLITEKTIAQFEIGKRRLRLNTIQISIDGSQPEIHDKSRPNSFERAIRGLRLLVAHDFPVTVRVTINRHNVHDLENIARLLLEDVGLHSFGCNEAYACGQVYRVEDGVMLSPEQREFAKETLIKLTQEYPGRISATAGPLAMARELRMVNACQTEGITELDGRGHLTGCGCSFRKIAILHDGTVVPCHQLSFMPIGKLGEDDLQELWLNNDVETTLRTRRAIPLSDLDTCADCEYQGYCTGGCPGMPAFLEGKLNARDPFSCIRIHKGEDPFISPDMLETLQPYNPTDKGSK